MESLPSRLGAMGRDGVQRWLLVFVGFNVVLFAFVFFALWVTGGFADWEMGAGGWVALCLGVVATSALGVALMALIFYSDRGNYDENAYRVVPPEDGGPPPEEK